MFINGLKLAGIELDRKILSDLAITDAAGFAALTVTAKDAVAKAKADRTPAQPLNSALKSKRARPAAVPF